jgi:hypothetical protein
MPLPTPNDNESERDFVTRCMASDAAQEFKDEKQRAAVCYSQWRGDKRKTLGRVQYHVKAQAIEQDGKRYAAVEIIDENISRPCESPPETRVRINPAGKARALARLMGTPILGPPELGHDATRIVGNAVDFESNHATRVLYEIPSLEDWAHIDAGEWGPVSPHMIPSMAHYDGDVYVLDEWMWEDVAFVPRGAWPNAGAKSTCKGDPRLCGFHMAVSAALTSHGLEPSGSTPRQDVADYSPTGRQVDREKTVEKLEVENILSCEHDKVIAELTDKNNALGAQVKDFTAKGTALQAKYDELSEKHKGVEAELKQAKASSTTVTASKEALDKVEADLKTVKAEAESLKVWKQAREDADHMERVQAVLDLRVKAGLLETKDVAAATERFKKLSDDALDLMTVDLTKVYGKFDSLPSGPKARLIPSAVGARFNPLEDTVGSLVGVPLGQVRAAEQPGVKA